MTVPDDQATTVAGKMDTSYVGDNRMDDFSGVATGSKLIFVDVGCDTPVRSKYM